MLAVIVPWLRVQLGGVGDDEGASLVEYALLLGLIAIVCIAAVAFFGDATSQSFSKSGSAFP